MIPRRLHLWWHHRDPPASALTARDAWAELHPNWVTTLWTNENPVLEALGQASLNQDDVIEADRVRHISNVVRWHLLRDQGGVWVDCDTEPIAPIDDIAEPGTPFCGSALGPEPTVIGGPPGHPMWDALIRLSVRRFEGSTSPGLSGAHVLALVVPAHPDVRVLAPGLFFDRDSRGHPIAPPVGNTRRCRHRWDSSSRQAVHG